MSTPPYIGGDPIGELMPWTEGEERRLRNGLLIIQQRAATRARSANSEAARDLYWLANATAAERATAPATVAELREVRAGLINLALAGNMFERLEAAEVSPQASRKKAA